MVIMATLSVLMVPRFLHNDATIPAQADQLARALRNTQSLAMTRGSAVTLDILSASSYSITDGTATLRDPGGRPLSFNLQHGANFTSGADIKFDTLGRPVLGTTLITAPQSWTLNGAATVSIEPVTGFVSVTP